MFSSGSAAGLATATPGTAQHEAASAWPAPSPLLAYAVAPAPVQSIGASPLQQLTPGTTLQPSMLAARSAAVPSGYLQLPATMLTLGSSISSSMPMVAAPIVAAPLSSQLAAAVQPPVMHPNLVTTLKSIIDKPTKSSSPPPGHTDAPGHRPQRNASCDRTPVTNRSSVSSSHQCFMDTYDVKQEVQSSSLHDAAAAAAAAAFGRARGVKRGNEESLFQEQEQERKMLRTWLPVSHMMPYATASRSTIAGAGSSPLLAARPLSRNQPAVRKGGRSPQMRAAEAVTATVVPVDLIHNRRPFLCQWAGCNKTFKNWQTLKMHLKTHDGGDSMMLPAWGDAMSPWHGAGRAGQNKKIPSRCPECGNTFVGLYELRRHYGRKHNQGEKPFACRKCNKRFFVEVDLRDHEKVCGESLQCRCGMRFAFKCNLVNHVRLRPECQTAPLKELASASAADSGPGGGDANPNSPNASPKAHLDAMSTGNHSAGGQYLGSGRRAATQALSGQASTAPAGSLSGDLLEQAARHGAVAGSMTRGMLPASPGVSLGTSPGTSHGSSQSSHQHECQVACSSPPLMMSAPGTAEAGSVLALGPHWNLPSELDFAAGDGSPRSQGGLPSPWTQASGIHDSHQALQGPQVHSFRTVASASAPGLDVLRSSYTDSLQSGSSMPPSGQTPGARVKVE